MAWFEQVDLGFGSIQDQFTDLLGEASTLLETANKLDILNLDEMAVQEEIAAALEEEAEYEEEEEIVHHDEVHNHNPYDIPPVENPQEAESVINDESQLSHENKSARGGEESPDLSKETVDVDVAEGVEVSISTPQKSDSQSQNISPVRNIGLDDSFSWEGVEAKPAKQVKLTVLSDATKDNKANKAVAPLPAAQFSIVDSDGESSKPKLLPAKTAPAQTAVKSVASGAQTKPTATTGITKSAILPSASTTSTSTSTSSTNNTAAPVGRKVKPLKPKPKSKELDFWGVNSKKALKLPDSANVNKGGKDGTVSGTAANVSSTAGTAAAEQSAAMDMFFGPVGLFGDDAYVTDLTEVDLEAARSETTLPPHPGSNNNSGTGGTSNVGYNTTGADNGCSSSSSSGGGGGGSTAHQHARLPMGWFSGMVSAAGADGGTATSQVTPSFSFFDNLESELPEEEDPILKQVAYNKNNPHVQVEISPINKVLDMWNSFMAAEDPVVPSSAGGAHGTSPTGTGGMGVGVGGGTTAGCATSASTATVEVFSTGTGPAWVVTVLTWFRKITGVALIILEPTSQAVRYSGVVFTDTTSLFPNWAFLTVKITLPADINAKTVLVFVLHILRFICICILSIVVRICICIYTAVRYIGAYISGSGIGTGAVSARLRRYFANDNVNAILGTSAPAEETWQQRSMNSARQWAAWCWEQMNSTNGIMVVTATLFIFSYFKFQRYGTDAGD